MNSSNALLIDANHKGNKVIGYVWGYGHMATWPPARSKLKIKLQMYLFNNGILQKK